ncbi:hypothetical protein MHBO_002167 [Bonamia ostreae]|uniref:Uncharacterized protein n=1 Tax=Bonamia ostreae TaxID=126728 RepID=A0ABV2ALD6_9EUKA
MYIVLSPFKIIRFSLSEFSLLFFLFPNFIFIVETYLERKSSPENATNFYLFFNIIFCCILMWLLPFIFHPISLNTNLIIAVNFALLLICFYVCYKIFSKKVNLDVTNSLFTLFFTLNVICLSYINFSLALVNSIAITPFLSISRTKTSTCKKFVLFVYLFFLSNFFFGVLYSVSNEKSQFGKMWEDLLKGYLDVTTFRNINYFCFFVHFFPSLFLLLFRINFRCKFGKDKKD